MDWQKLFRTALELAGVIERQDTAVRRRLAAISQSKARGPVTVILEDLGPKRISALTAVRKVTGLNLDEALALAENMLPVPLLTNVDQETAVLACDLLEAMGASVRLVGAAETESQPQIQRRDGEFSPDIDEIDVGTKLDVGVSIPVNDSESLEAEGVWVAILLDASLLPDRVTQVLQRLAGWSREEAAATISDLPQPILLGASQEAAFKMQRELQMLGAVVDVLLWEEYDDSQIE